MPLRLFNRTVQVTLDVAILSFAYWLAFLFRFEFSLTPHWVKVVLFTWPYVILMQYAALALFGVPRLSWRYISIGDVLRLLSATMCSTVALAVVRLAGPHIAPRVDSLV